MDIELICLNKAISFNDLKMLFFIASQPPINRLCLSSSLLNTLPDVKSSLELCALIDFPDGLQVSSTRVADMLYSIRSGAKYIDLVMNNTCIMENYVKIKNEYKAALVVCKENNCKLRPILEYRLHDVSVILTLCEELLKIGITDVVTATGRMADDFIDNLLISREIQEKVGLNVTFCGNSFTKPQFEQLKNAQIGGLRASINTLEKIIDIKY